MSDEPPQEAAERIWEETAHDPVATMERFDEWARETPERILSILGVYWQRAVRGFLTRAHNHKGWKHGSAFYIALRKRENQQDNAKKPGRFDGDPTVRQTLNENSRRYYERRRNGIKIVQAEVKADTGELLALIDKEFGPFAHIRVNGCLLPEVTPRQALWYCEEKTGDVQFIRRLCRMIPDQNRPIGEQWTPEMIRKAKADVAGSEAA